MREIKHLVVHCSATPPSLDVGAKEIRRWHKDRGWRDIGYHWVIRRDGGIEPGRPIEAIGAHVAGKNSHSIGICLIGGVDDDNNAERNYTTEQYESLRALLSLHSRLFFSAEILGHRDFNVPKDCPSFDVKKWWYNLE